MSPIAYNYHHLLKLLIIGNSGVGKSSLLMRFADDCYEDQHIYTIGVDFKIRTLFIDGKVIKLQIWDTAGQERFRAFTTSYFRGADGVVVTYDITNNKSFCDVKNWLREIELKANNPQVEVLLIGNKCDMNEARVIQFEDARHFANELGILFVEASAKDGTNVEAAFHLIASRIVISQAFNFYESNNKLSCFKSSINISADDKCKKGCC